jgi:hypothetical protein
MRNLLLVKILFVVGIATIVYLGNQARYWEHHSSNGEVKAYISLSSGEIKNLTRKNISIDSALIDMYLWNPCLEDSYKTSYTKRVSRNKTYYSSESCEGFEFLLIWKYSAYYAGTELYGMKELPQSFGVLDSLLGDGDTITIYKPKNL